MGRLEEFGTEHAALHARYRACRATLTTSRSLAYPPEERQRPFDNPAHVPAPRLVFQEEASRRIDDGVERGLVEAADHGLLLLQRLGLIPRGHLRLDLGCVRPAEPGLVSARPHTD